MREGVSGKGIGAVEGGVGERGQGKEVVGEQGGVEGDGVGVSSFQEDHDSYLHNNKG